MSKQTAQAQKKKNLQKKSFNETPTIVYLENIFHQLIYQWIDLADELSNKIYFSYSSV